MLPSTLNPDRVEKHDEPPVLKSEMDGSQVMQGMIAARNQAEAARQLAVSVAEQRQQEIDSLRERAADLEASVQRYLAEANEAKESAAASVGPLVKAKEEAEAKLAQLTEAFNEERAALVKAKEESDELTTLLQKELDDAKTELAAADEKIAALTKEIEDAKPAADEEQEGR